MKKTLLPLAGCLLLAVTHVSAMPFAKGDPKAGKALHDKSCVACHDSKMYTRAEHKVKTPAQLAGRVSGCNANTGAGWFPEEELHVSSYLNQQFYKFK